MVTPLAKNCTREIPDEKAPPSGFAIARILTPSASILMESTRTLGRFAQLV